MEYTQNYQLPLWDKEDSVLRTDFNENNQKIDAALEENHNRVLLQQFVLGSDADSFDVDMTGLMQQDFWQLEIYLEGTGGDGATSAYVRFNGKSDGTDYQYRSFNGTNYDVSCFGSLPLSTAEAKKRGRIILYPHLTYVGGYCEQLGSMPSQMAYRLQKASGVTCDSLTTVNFIANSGIILAGAKVSIYGVHL